MPGLLTCAFSLFPYFLLDQVFFFLKTIFPDRPNKNNKNIENIIFFS